MILQHGEFYIQCKFLKIYTNGLESMKQLRQVYLKVFDRPALKVTLTMWLGVLEALKD